MYLKHEYSKRDMAYTYVCVDERMHDVCKRITLLTHVDALERLNTDNVRYRRISCYRID